MTNVIFSFRPKLEANGKNIVSLTSYSWVCKHFTLSMMKPSRFVEFKSERNDSDDLQSFYGFLSTNLSECFSTTSGL